MAYDRNIMLIIGVLVCSVTICKGLSNNVTNDCESRDFCADSNGSTIFIKKNCFCDDACLQYGDCCQDSNVLQNDHVSDPLSHKFYKCIRLDENGHFGYQMVAVCPNDWPNDEIKKRCQSPVENSKFFTAIPLTNPWTDVTYRNLFCAACHNETLRFLTEWELKVECEKRRYSETFHQWRYNSDYHQWEAVVLDNGEEATRNCSTNLKPPENITSLRQCYPDLISKCPPHRGRFRMSPGIWRLCYERTAFRFTSDSVYKNRYCAQCHGISESELRCNPYGLVSSPPVSRVLGSHNLLSYTMFLHGALDNLDSHLCPEGQILNPSGVCENFHCSRNTIKINGKCVEF